MLERFRKYIFDQNLIDEHNHVVLSVSGGIDSMVMTDLFLKSKIPFALAHCNFKLRGDESDGDAVFVKEYAAFNNIDFYSKSFDTKAYAALNKISIQMAARELRMQWFEELLKENNFETYATAHHLDDQIETFFINLLRGSGIAGLRGILPKQGKLFHPMLFCYRSDIELYAKRNNIKFRTDSSNMKLIYQRNQIRHELIPLFESLKKGFKSVMIGNMENLKAAEHVYHDFIQNIRQEIVVESSAQILIKKQGISNFAKEPSVLFELIRDYDFNYTQAESILLSINGDRGKVFQSYSHRLIVDRADLIIEPLQIKESGFYAITKEDTELETPVQLKIISYPKKPNLNISNQPHIAMLNADIISFPLILRRWQKGDYFYPLGMSNRKLISDFFIDNKFSIPQKESTWILESNGKIVWVVGHRIDNRFKISTETKNILELHLKGIGQE